MRGAHWLLLALAVVATGRLAEGYDNYDSYSDNYYYDDDWYFTDDFAYDDYYMDYFDFLFDEDCVVTDSGEYVFNGTRPCDVLVSGGYEATKLDDGVAGLYVYTGCQNGKPMYKRVEAGADEPGFVPAAKAPEPRYIIYSSYWGDWDLGSDSVLTDDTTLAYGGEGEGESFPQFVPRNDWYVLASLSDDTVEEDFVYAPSLTVECNFNCSDGIQNGFELGVDCGGECEPCSYEGYTPEELRDQQQAEIKLHMKVKAEGKLELSAFEKGMIVLLSFLGTAIVAGGPLMYYLKHHFDPKAQRAPPGRR